MKTQQRGLMIAAPASGSGKTVVTLALLRSLRDRGLDIRAAKSGPDYIDPQFHEVACGAASVNLDAWAMLPERLAELAGAQEGTHLLVEAAMGLFDGADDGSEAGSGSAADLAAALGLPVVLVLDASRQSQSVAALVSGFAAFRDDVRIAGIILNRVGSDRHEAMLRRALAPTEITVLGAIYRNPELVLPERHLGLVQAGELPVECFVEKAARLVSESVDLDALKACFALVKNGKSATRLPPLGQRIAIASDTAFSFAYPHMLADWRAQGAELSFFSPLEDEAPAGDCDAVFLPGGYPELHGGRLAQARAFKSGMKQAAWRGALIYGECGGYMALGQGLVDGDGVSHAMCGLLDLETSFAKRKRSLGYRQIEAGAGFALGSRMRGHEFHYSSTVSARGDPLFAVRNAAGTDLGNAGLRHGNVMGSYLHVIDAA